MGGEGKQFLTLFLFNFLILADGTVTFFVILVCTTYDKFKKGRDKTCIAKVLPSILKKIFQQVPVVDTVNNNEAIINKASPRFIDYSVIYTVP